MSAIKPIGIMALAGAVVSGGISAHEGFKARKISLENAQKVASENGGKLPVKGMTKDGKIWDKDMTVDDVRKFANKSLLMGVTMNSIAGAATSAAIAGLTLLAHSRFKK